MPFGLAGDFSMYILTNCSEGVNRELFPPPSCLFQTLDSSNISYFEPLLAHFEQLRCLCEAEGKRTILRNFLHC